MHNTSWMNTLTSCKIFNLCTCTAYYAFWTIMSGCWIAIDFTESEEGGTSAEFIPKFNFTVDHGLFWVCCCKMDERMLWRAGPVPT